ncbi:MAG: sulfoxide reductase heme-binding subunit YedZ, partial [Sphingobium sp. 32-64-5]
PLALTSTRGMIRRLGGRRWQRLHRLVYAAAMLASIHFVMRVKGFQVEPWIYVAILTGLLGYRLVRTVRARV